MTGYEPVGRGFESLLAHVDKARNYAEIERGYRLFSCLKSPFGLYLGPYFGKTVVIFFAMSAISSPPFISISGGYPMIIL